MWKTGRIMSCEMNEHPLGWEIRCYLRSDFHYSHVSRTREGAEQEAEAKKQELVALGWTDPPPMHDQSTRGFVDTYFEVPLVGDNRRAA
jgi:hypothetical protein